jgi:peptidoglycan/xylan/chitin deacetylase (PgdA/CDA1 family)
MARFTLMVLFVCLGVLAGCSATQIGTTITTHPASSTTVTTARATSTSSSPATTTTSPSTAPSEPPVTLPITLPTALSASTPSLEVPILMYHMVDLSPPPAGPYSAALTVSTSDFELEMDYLAGHGFSPVTLEDIYTAMAGRRVLPPKPVAITFDDGNKDNFTVAFPILRAHGFVATFFVITGSVGNKLSMTWDDLRTMQAAGMAVESHTYDHKDLRTLDAAALRQELAGSRDSIAAHLGRVPLVLCYPGGKYNETVIAAAQAAGYLMAVTTNPGKRLDPAHRYEWPRVRVYAHESLRLFISGLT